MKKAFELSSTCVLFISFMNIINASSLNKRAAASNEGSRPVKQMQKNEDEVCYNETQDNLMPTIKQCAYSIFTNKYKRCFLETGLKTNDQPLPFHKDLIEALNKIPIGTDVFPVPIEIDQDWDGDNGDESNLNEGIAEVIIIDDSSSIEEVEEHENDPVIITNVVGAYKQNEINEQVTKDNNLVEFPQYAASHSLHSECCDDDSNANIELGYDEGKTEALGDSVNTFTPETEKNCSIKSMFIETGITLLKNIIYYRFNITKFFAVFHNKSHYKIANKKKLNNELVPETLMKFIELAVAFAATDERNAADITRLTTVKEYARVKLLEKWLADECKKGIDVDKLKVSNQFIAIKNYNRDYVRATTIFIKKTSFKPVYDFLDPFFSHSNNSCTKYYNMIYCLLKSIHNFSELIDKRLDKSVQNYLLDTNAFDVRMCNCSKETRQHFIFHWVICWISYFSKHGHLPTVAEFNASYLSVLNSYPKEFFLQIIVLAHTVINFELKKVTTIDIDKSFLKNFKYQASYLLFNNINVSTVNLYSIIMHNLLRNSRFIFNNRINKTKAALCLEVTKSAYDSLQLANKLIPTLQYILESICKIATDTFLCSKVVSNTS